VNVLLNTYESLKEVKQIGFLHKGLSNVYDLMVFLYFVKGKMLVIGHINFRHFPIFKVSNKYQDEVGSVYT
jgi:hypothetical protein